MSQKPQPLQQSFRKFGQSSKSCLKAGSGARHIFFKCSGRADVFEATAGRQAFFRQNSAAPAFVDRVASELQEGQMPVCRS